MYTSLHIQNFRGFRDLKIESLGRINLIGGKNDVGKTALLEAIFLLCGPGNPKLRFVIESGRGVDSIFVSPALPSRFWESLFREFDVQQGIRISSVLDGQTVCLKINVLQAAESGQLPLPLGESSSDISSTAEYQPEQIEYVYVRGLEKHVSRACIIGDKLEVEPKNIPGLRVAIFAFARRQPSPEDIANRYSQVEKSKLNGEVLTVLRLVEPKLEAIKLLYEHQKPVLYGDIGLPKLVPLTLLGDGLGCLLMMLVNIVSVAPGGYVLIDEIENGIHFSVMPRVWRALNKFSDKHNVQIFATTHSYECIRAAKEAFEADNALADFRYHRLDRLENGDIEAVTYDEEALMGAFEFTMEVR